MGGGVRLVSEQVDYRHTLTITPNRSLRLRWRRVADQSPEDTYYCSRPAARRATMAYDTPLARQSTRTALGSRLTQ